MAKIKIHELAKELEKQSKEIISFLQEKGIEAKAAQSAIEEDTAEMVRKHFGAVSDEAAKSAPALKEEKAEKAASQDAKKASETQDAQGTQ
ncbi:MAG: translation initiation factor IF-2 N-terminal domain-containing protein, partial [Lachnospiraceae bacterium]